MERTRKVRYNNHKQEIKISMLDVWGSIFMTRKQTSSKNIEKTNIGH